MRFDIYCDESHPDLFSSKLSNATHLVIGGLWLQSSDRSGFKKEIHDLRDRFKIGGEFGWTSISRSKLDFFLHLIDWFFSKGDSLRFRFIAVERTKVDLIRFHQSDQELAFYKFYYQMLHGWILDFNQYHIFCDSKTNKQKERIKILESCLVRSNLSSEISIQSIRSDESVLLQTADLLTGAASAVFNAAQLGESKARVLDHLQRQLGGKIRPTHRNEAKFNAFLINPGGGW